MIEYGGNKLKQQRKCGQENTVRVPSLHFVFSSSINRSHFALVTPLTNRLTIILEKSSSSPSAPNSRLLHDGGFSRRLPSGPFWCCPNLFFATESSYNYSRETRPAARLPSVAATMTCPAFVFR